ncbi:MAG: hypothetical protein IKN12_00205 [Selenomonadaceae bacterium]|nr:hypothetical protein [Selenomonadaceae bacterium]
MKYLELKRGNEKINVCFRPMKDGDASVIVKCIQDEYGETYFKRSFYDTAEIIKYNADGHIRFFLAELDTKEIIGMVVLKRFLPREEMCEIASMIFLKEYRGFKMAYPFFQYTEEFIKSIDKTEPVSAIFCLPVLFHDITQKLMERLGLVPTGFVFGKFLIKNIRHSYGVIDAPKHPQGIMIKKLARQSAGEVFIPAEHREIASKMYRELGVDFTLARGDAECENLEESVISHEDDDIQQNSMIYVDKAGRDIAEKVQAIQKISDGKNATFSVFLNISDRGAIGAYKKLRALGYFFAGFQPLCSPREIMVLHNPMGVPLKLETLSLTPAFAYWRDYVEKCSVIK